MSAVETATVCFLKSYGQEETKRLGNRKRVLNQRSFAPCFFSHGMDSSGKAKFMGKGGE